MDTKLAIDKARQLKISVVQIVREEYEMILLAPVPRHGRGSTKKDLKWDTFFDTVKPYECLKRSSQNNPFPRTV